MNALLMSVQFGHFLVSLFIHSLSPVCQAICKSGRTCPPAHCGVVALSIVTAQTYSTGHVEGNDVSIVESCRYPWERRSYC